MILHSGGGGEGAECDTRLIPWPQTHSITLAGLNFTADHEPRPLRVVGRDEVVCAGNAGSVGSAGWRAGVGSGETSWGWLGGVGWGSEVKRTNTNRTSKIIHEFSHFLETSSYRHYLVFGFDSTRTAACPSLFGSSPNCKVWFALLSSISPLPSLAPSSDFIARGRSRRCS